MSPGVRYEYHDLKPAAGSFLDDVVAGLSARPKALPPKYFYDERGSRLFEAICELPEYYPTRTELAMLESSAADIASRVGPRAAVVEYGSGSGRKTAVLLRSLQPLAYVAIDISGAQLRHAVAALAEAFPRMRTVGICADYTNTAHLEKLETIAADRRVVFFPGSTIGNFSVPEALAFLENAHAVAGRGGGMLVGVDLKKDPAVLRAAYNDAQGVTAAFNMNLIHRMNRELGADFDLDAFEHRAFYAAEVGRIEMHLVAKRSQRVTVAGRTFAFAAGETIHTENSYKYTVEEFHALARKAGFEPSRVWVDPQRLFSIHYLAVPG